MARHPGAGQAYLAGKGEYLVHRHGFLAGTPGIRISAGFRQPFSAGIYAGEGFVLQNVSGEGRAWIELAGEVVTRDLAAGESLRVHPGHVGMFTALGRLPGRAGARCHQPVLRRRRAPLRGAVRAGFGVAAVGAGARARRVAGAFSSPRLGVGPVKSEVTGIGRSSPGAGPLVVEELKSFTK
jgi:biogenesis AIM24-like protein